MPWIRGRCHPESIITERLFDVLSSLGPTVS